MTIHELNAQFGIAGVVDFEEGHGGLTRMAITSAHSNAHVYLHGAHVTHWHPAVSQPVLWMSNESWFEAGKPIRGGVPICFPWFGPHPDDPGLPAHGLARLIEWDVLSTGQDADLGVTVVMVLRDAGRTRPNWPGRFDLRYTVTVDAALTLTLEAANVGPQPRRVTQALHSYFRVLDVRDVAISGLENTQYLDATAGRRRKRQDDQPLRFTAETDRVYLNTHADCKLLDPGLRRAITVSKSGSQSTVVWNPWIAKAARMPDFGDDEWMGMVCIETANVADNAITIPPGGRHVLSARIACSAG